MKKRLIALICVVVLCVSMVPANAFADSTDSEILKAWVCENGQLTEISVEDYYNLVNNTHPVNITEEGISTNSNVNFPPVAEPMYEKYVSFNKSSEYISYLPAKQVSPTITGPGYAIAIEIVSVSATFSLSVTTDVKVKILDTVTVQAAFSAQTTAGNMSGAALQVDAGKQAVLMFNPKITCVSGMLRETYYYNAGGTYTDERWIDATFPVTLSNGVADGIYFLKEV